MSTPMARSIRPWLSPRHRRPLLWLPEMKAPVLILPVFAMPVL
ncbi:Uncharacterised protein [Mycobacterium tuberculosis]|uniref:Uncharacterized protein n=1 Tax=Mycobacterium tuberculosis TaxID=1773 RepID=A0A0U0U4L1_MYCTX|nr:Uncharacterised protein [Mycobacterium tuberculosis]CFA27466.1 Uncharacterised protein [Mycobacterium tuberculosis]CFA94756.1 Uncharacterised protein [Mycobacterium tuberculosis]CFC71355.1 Uncharacterised protein [Mycobacterium tuberculosis]CFD27620.1 Uncharacterised protein [Mycobacterium tuberculosis]